ncbi:MAG: hypothetical protein IKD53_12160 [Clostridia bacterium]|nr:hypothetical protein [Clostridia bacterium]
MRGVGIDGQGVFEAGQGGRPAALDVEVVDVWPPGRLSQTEKDAYDALASTGRIRPVRVDRDGAGRVYVRYMADCPEQWIREELREAKYKGRQMDLTEVEK